MKSKNRLWIGLGASAAVIGTVAGLTFVVMSLLGATVEESEPKPAQGVQTGRYPGLSICVESLSGDTAVEAIAKARVETAVLEVVKHQFWKLMQLDGAPPLVDIGCPSDPLVTRPGVTWVDAQYVGGSLAPYQVTEPSFYRYFVFVAPVEQIDEMLGGLVVRVAPQEMVTTGGDVSFEKTSALFVSLEELEDPVFLARQLTMTVGLEDPLADLKSTPQ